MQPLITKHAMMITGVNARTHTLLGTLSGRTSFCVNSGYCQIKPFKPHLAACQTILQTKYQNFNQIPQTLNICPVGITYCRQRTTHYVICIIN